MFFIQYCQSFAEFFRVFFVLLNCCGFCLTQSQNELTQAKLLPGYNCIQYPWFPFRADQSYIVIPCPYEMPYGWVFIEDNLKLYTAAQHCAWKCIHSCVAVYNLKIIFIALVEYMGCVVMQVAVFGVPSYLEYLALAQTTVVCGTWSTSHNWAEMVSELSKQQFPMLFGPRKNTKLGTRLLLQLPSHWPNPGH